MMEFKTRRFLLNDPSEIDLWLNGLLKGGFSAVVSGYSATPGVLGTIVLITVKRWRKESQPAPVAGSQIADVEEPTID